MPLASSTLLSPHFTARELGADRPEAHSGIVQALYAQADYLERVRVILNSRLVVNDATHFNRGFRPPEANAAVGGVPTSSHQTGEASDVVPIDFSGSLFDAHNALKKAKAEGRLPPFDQIIYYPANGFIHIGRGPKMRNEFRVSLYEGQGGTPLVSAENIAALGKAVLAAAQRNAPLLVLVLFAAVAIILTEA